MYISRSVRNTKYGIDTMFIHLYIMFKIHRFANRTCHPMMYVFSPRMLNSPDNFPRC